MVVCTIRMKIIYNDLYSGQDQESDYDVEMVVEFSVDGEKTEMVVKSVSSKEEVLEI